MQDKGKPIPELQDEIWLMELAFLVDMTTHLNGLNVSLQGREQTIVDLYEKIQAFRAKLNLWIQQISSNNYFHFPTLNEKFKDKITEDLKNLFTDVLEKLKSSFNERFDEFRKLKGYLEVTTIPFSMNENDIPVELQMEILQLKHSILLRDRFEKMPLKEFIFLLPEDKYPIFRKVIIRMLSMFGSTYVCEQLFSVMNVIKNDRRSRLTDEHLEAAVRIKVSNIPADISALAGKKRAQISPPT